MNTMDSCQMTLIKLELKRLKGIIEKLLIVIENHLKTIEQNTLKEVLNKHFSTEMIEDE